jgi:hypothetical protein
MVVDELLVYIAGTPQMFNEAGSFQFDEPPMLFCVQVC